MALESMLKRTNQGIVSLRDTSCDVQNEDGKYVFVAWIQLESINKKPEVVQALLAEFKRYNEKTLLSEAHDGVYNWMIYSESEDEAAEPQLKFVCTQVLSPFEIGTRHQALAYGTQVGRIYGAGELTKSDGKIQFNLVSGTYTHKIVQYNFSRNKSKSKRIAAAFKTFFPPELVEEAEMGSTNSMINSIRRVPNHLLELYKRYGFTVILFDDKNTCVKFNNTFNSFDWRIRYYRDKLDKYDAKTDEFSEKIYRDSLISNIEGMLELLKSHLNTSKTGVNVSGSRANISGTRLGGSRLGGSRRGGSRLGGSSLGGSRLGGSSLGGSRLGGSSLSVSRLGASRKRHTRRKQNKIDFLKTK
jgi:hypothetical protein